MSEAPSLDRALREYGDLIRSLHETTDKLLEALAAPGIEDAGELVELRSALCERLSACGETLEPLIAGPDRRRSMPAEIRRGLESLGEKQRACEAALACRIGRCRSELESLKRQSGACLAYQGGHREQDARFLDIVR